MAERSRPLEAMVTSHQPPWVDTPVFITGHTGFKGAWLSLWLKQLGSQVHGYALDPPTTPNMFEVAGVSPTLTSETRADILDLATLRQALERAQPTVVFHLAAQTLVRVGYDLPLETFATNTLGTAHLLEAIRGLSCVKAVVIVTTDKVYDNVEWPYPYREIDPLGGHDPYSASKAAAEIVTASYRASFFANAGGVQIATARAGNVIGGGDWATDRLIPDCLRAFEKGDPVRLRYPHSVRPWQHVLDPLAGYLQLAEKLLQADGAAYAKAWNFGPNFRGNAMVQDVAHMVAQLWGHNARIEVDSSSSHPHEASVLRLDISRTCNELGWQPRWSVEQALQATVEWHRQWLSGQDMQTVSSAQIQAYNAV